MPQRYNLVLTKDKNVKNDIDRDYSEVEVFSCFEEAIMWAKKEGFEKIFVVGGEKIYRESLPSCEEIFLTEVDANFDGDTFFLRLNGTIGLLLKKGMGARKTMDYGIVFVTLKEKTNTLTFLAMLRLFAQYICHLYPCMIPNKPPIPQKNHLGTSFPCINFCR